MRGGVRDREGSWSWISFLQMSCSLVQMETWHVLQPARGEKSYGHGIFHAL